MAFSPTEKHGIVGWSALSMHDMLCVQVIPNYTHYDPKSTRQYNFGAFSGAGIICDSDVCKTNNWCQTLREFGVMVGYLKYHLKEMFGEYNVKTNSKYKLRTA